MRVVTGLLYRYTTVVYWGPLCRYHRLMWKKRNPLVVFPLPPRHRTPDSQGRRGSCKLTGMQTDTETHGCVGKLPGRRRDKLERTEEVKEDRRGEKAAKVSRYSLTSGLSKKSL